MALSLKTSGIRILCEWPLVDLDPTDVHTDLETLPYNQGQAALDAEVARLLLTRDPHATFNRPDNVDPALAEANHAEALNEIGKHLAQIAGIDLAIAKQNAILSRHERSNRAGAENAAAADGKVNQTALGLYQKQYGPRPPVLDAEQLVIEKQAELKSAQATLLQTQADISRSRTAATKRRRPSWSTLPINAPQPCKSWHL